MDLSVGPVGAYGRRMKEDSSGGNELAKKNSGEDQTRQVIGKELGQKETLVDKIRKRKLTWFGQVVRMDDKRLQARELYCHMEGTQSQGRQTKMWMESVRQDLAEKDMDLRIALDTIRE